MRLILRAMREEDRNYILSSWLRSAAEGPEGRSYVSRYSYIQDLKPVVHDLLSRSVVLIASPEEDEDIIAGYAVVEGDRLHYLLTKPRFRRLGVAGTLVGEWVERPLVYTFQPSVNVRVPEAWSYRPLLRFTREAA